MFAYRGLCLGCDTNLSVCGQMAHSRLFMYDGMRVSSSLRDGVLGNQPAERGGAYATHEVLLSLSPPVVVVAQQQQQLLLLMRQLRRHAPLRTRSRAA